VQAYGKQVGSMTLTQQKNAIGAAVGQGGLYDYQRNGDIFYPAYTNASNYAVGVLMQGAGYPQWETDLIGGAYASMYSGQGWTALQTEWWNNGWTAANNGTLPLPLQTRPTDNNATACRVGGR
jgi:hypothetical protein